MAGGRRVPVSSQAAGTDVYKEQEHNATSSAKFATEVAAASSRDLAAAITDGSS